jgi:hypothetical protein
MFIRLEMGLQCVGYNLGMGLQCVGRVPVHKLENGFTVCR